MILLQVLRVDIGIGVLGFGTVQKVKRCRNTILNDVALKHVALTTHEKRQQLKRC